MTNEVPNFTAWIVDPLSSESIERVKDVLICEELGNAQSSYYESVHLYVPFNENFQKARIISPVKRIKFRLYENGIKLLSESWGNILFFYSDFEKVELYRKLNKPALRVFPKDKMLFGTISQESYYIFFSGLAVSDIFLKLPQIFEEKGVNFSFVDDLPENI